MIASSPAGVYGLCAKPAVCSCVKFPQYSSTQHDCFHPLLISDSKRVIPQHVCMVFLRVTYSSTNQGWCHFCTQNDTSFYHRYFSRISWCFFPLCMRVKESGGLGAKSVSEVLCGISRICVFGSSVMVI